MNPRLTIGIVLLLPVLVAALFGPALAPTLKALPNRYTMRTSPRDAFLSPPTPPSELFLLGTNIKGQDMLTLILYGARWTVGTTAVLAALKVLVGSILGITGAFGKHRPFKGVRTGPLNALPLLVFLYFLLARISMNFPFNPMILVALFGLIILIFGTPASASALETMSRDLMKKEYYVAAEAAGAGPIYLIRHHILPFMKERLVTLFISEMIATLNIIGQLGIFGVFLAGTVVTFSPRTQHSRVHDWAGLIGQARFNIFNDHWILLGPLGGYILLLIALYLISEGLQIQFRKAYRR